ncbi:hypothetical protein [Acetobacter pasteurianus]|uniref:hypothetical protein n=1 Tax=Acetobacter pasteurianus TaxID=438 RepID=UPI003D10EA88
MRIEQLRNEFIRLKVRECFREMSEMDGYYGLGLLYVDVGLVRTRGCCGLCRMMC